MGKSYVYMLRCADGTLYTGWTADLLARVRAHNGEGRMGAKYTRSRRPVTLAYYEICSNQSAAMRREAALKRLARLQKEELISIARATGYADGDGIPYAILPQEADENKKEE